MTNKNQWVLTAKELLDIQEKLKFLKDRKLKVESNLRELSNNKSASEAGYKYNLFTRPGSIDYSSIPELQDINLDEYRKEEQKYWKLSFTKQFDI